MKRSTNTKKQDNTLFSYFSKVKDPKKEKETLSALIKKTTRIEINQTIKPVPKKQNDGPIDLTLEEDDNDVIEILSASPTPENSQQTDSQSSFGSFTKRQRSNNEILTNTSKYNNRKWLQDTKDFKPLPSSQEPVDYSSQEKQAPRRNERIVLKKTPVPSSPAYGWLSDNDVKPYSSNYSEFKFVDPIRKPEIHARNLANTKRDIYVSSSSNSSNSSYESTYINDKKRGWNDMNNSIPLASSYKSSSQYNETASNFWSNSSDNNNSNKRGKIDMVKGTAKLGSFAIGNKSSKDKQYRPELSDEQRRVLNMVLNEKKSMFFTGSAGTGKSVLLRAMIDELGQRYGSQLAVTASTGIAACNINGCTLNSFAGIGLGKESGPEHARQIKDYNKKARDRWMQTKVLIIDEISMVDAELFDKLELIARVVRTSLQPFGGIQVIVTGDFFQLPPVNPTRVSKFAFEANTWSTVIQKTVLLTKVFRQKDGTFVRFLNEMRTGNLSEEGKKKFASLSRKPEGDDDIEPTELYPLRQEVDLSNKRRLDSLKGEEVTFHAIDSGDPRKMQSCLAPSIMTLKEHAQVMLLKNLDADLVNGSIGVVIGFVGKGRYTRKEQLAKLRTPARQRDAFIDDGGELDMKTPYPIVKFTGGRTLLLERESWTVELPGGKESASRSQIPLMLAWAISIHKSQGQTLDRVKVDLGKVFEKGQAYVALSRATSLDRLQILNFDHKRVMAHPGVTKFYNSLRSV